MSLKCNTLLILFTGGEAKNRGVYVFFSTLLLLKRWILVCASVIFTCIDVVSDYIKGSNFLSGRYLIGVYFVSKEIYQLLHPEEVKLWGWVTFGLVWLHCLIGVLLTGKKNQKNY